MEIYLIWDVTQLLFHFFRQLTSRGSPGSQQTFSFFSLSMCLQVEEKQRASVAFTKLLTAMETLSFSAGEQKAIWHVLAAIYHLGAAGACKGDTLNRQHHQSHTKHLPEVMTNLCTSVTHSQP